MQLSIIVPVYNAEKYLSECLESLTKPGVDDYEIIVVDDKSTDGSAAIYEKFEGLRNVKVIKLEKNSGVSAARNCGIENAVGEYIMFVDADDYLLDNWHEVVKRYIDSSIDLVIFSDNYKGEKYSRDDLLKACIGFGNNSISNCSIMLSMSRLYRTGMLKQKKIKFDEKLINGEDLLFNFEVIMKVESFELVHDGFYFYRENPYSATKNFKMDIIDSDKNFHEYFGGLIRDNNYDKLLKRETEISKLNGLFIITDAISKQNRINYNSCFKYYFDTVCLPEMKSCFEQYSDYFPLGKRIIIKNILHKKIRRGVIFCKIRNLLKKARSVFVKKGGRVI